MSLPLRVGYKVAIMASDLRHLFAHEDRKAVSDNLRLIFPEKTEKEIGKIRKSMFRNFAKYLIDFFRFEKINKEYIEKNISVKNLHYFNNELAKGKGVIIVSAHLGNWELGAVLVSLLGYPLWAVALSHKDKKVNRFFNSQRESKGVKVIPLGIAVKSCVEVLRKGELIALVGDRLFGERGIVLDFFGRPTLFPKGPAAFALKTGASLVPAFLLRNKDDSFTLHIEKPIEFTVSQDREKDLIDITIVYKELFERFIRSYPDQWYMFRRFPMNNNKPEGI